MGERAGLTQPAILITGITGNVGRRLAPLLKDHPLVGVDLFPAPLDHPFVEFSALDLSQADAPRRLAALLRENDVRQVIHLAFVLDPTRTGALERQRQWEINIRGTEHLLDALEEVNRGRRQVEFFLYLSSVTSYGPMLPEPVKEDAPLRPGTYLYAQHKKETDALCQARHAKLGGCAVYIVRGHIFLGRGVENFISRILRGEPSDRGWLGRWVKKRGWRLPIVLPAGRRYGALYQFMHIDDAARLMAWLSKHYEPGKLEVLNAQGRGRPVSGLDCGRLGGLPVIRLPGFGFVALLARLGWALGVSSMPPDAFPYFAGSYVMNTEKLERLLGPEYEKIVRYTTEEALREMQAR